MDYDIGAVVCVVRATETQELRSHMGIALQNACLTMVSQQSRELGDTLHHDAGHRRKAYATSGLHQMDSLKPVGKGEITVGFRAWFRVCGLWLDVVKSIEIWLENNHTIEIDHHLWEIEMVIWEDHPLSGRTSYHQLTLDAQQGELPETVTFDFIMPVIFRRNDLSHPLPTPRLVFSNLDQRWRELTGDASPKVFNTFIEYFVAVHEFDLQGWFQWAHQERLLGSIGTVTYNICINNFKRLEKDASYYFRKGNITYEDAAGLYELLSSDHRLLDIFRRATLRLARYAHYAGIGIKTSQGFGMVAYNSPSTL